MSSLIDVNVDSAFINKLRNKIDIIETNLNTKNKKYSNREKRNNRSI